MFALSLIDKIREAPRSLRKLYVAPDSRNLEVLARRYRGSGVWNTEFSSTRNLDFKDTDKESGIYGVESRIYEWLELLYMARAMIALC